MAEPKRFLLFNIGCIECGVSSAVVGVFEAREEAEQIAERLRHTHSWREGGQNGFEVFELPEAPNTIASEYVKVEEPA